MVSYVIILPLYEEFARDISATFIDADTRINGVGKGDHVDDIIIFLKRCYLPYQNRGDFTTILSF